VVADLWASGAGRSAGAAGERFGRFAALVRADRAAVVASYVAGLEASGNPLVGDPCCRERVVADAVEVLGDVVASVEAGGAGGGGEGRLLRPVDSLRAAAAFFDVVVSALGRHVGDDPEFLPCFLVAVRALNESLGRRIREGAVAYTGFLLNRVHRAHVDERHRIARELHDRLGEGLSVGLRQLDLREIAGPADPLDRVAIAREALAGTMRQLRLVTSDLRAEPVSSLEKALLRFLDSTAADAHVRLRVSGDERWAPPLVIDESFLVIREAVRNALAHGGPQLVLIGVDLSPGELRAVVEDDGRGFAAAAGGQRGAGGSGLASMRERAALLGGRLAVSSVPGHGTRVELVVSLPGHCDERPG
jgi:signal transduction histidine kinase